MSGKERITATHIVEPPSVVTTPSLLVGAIEWLEHPSNRFKIFATIPQIEDDRDAALDRPVDGTVFAELQRYLEARGVETDGTVRSVAVNLGLVDVLHDLTCACLEEQITAHEVACRICRFLLEPTNEN